MSNIVVPGSSFPLEATIIVGALCGLIVVVLFFICCLSCILCNVPPQSDSPRDKREPMVLKWADTEPGNVELLAMRTFSETILEPATTTEEEIKKEDTNEEVTAGTFGFQGEVINNEEIIMVECNDADTETKQPVEESQPATTTFSAPSDKPPQVGVEKQPDLVPVVIALEEATPTKQPSVDLPEPDKNITLMSAPIEPHEPIVDTAKPTTTNCNKATEEVTSFSTSTAADIGKGLEQPMASSPNILSMDDIDKALGISSLDMQLMDIPGTSL